MLGNLLSTLLYLPAAEMKRTESPTNQKASEISDAFFTVLSTAYYVTRSLPNRPSPSRLRRYLPPQRHSRAEWRMIT